MDNENLMSNRVLQNIQRYLPFLEVGTEKKTKIMNSIFFSWNVTYL